MRRRLSDFRRESTFNQSMYQNRFLENNERNIPNETTSLFSGIRSESNNIADIQNWDALVREATEVSNDLENIQFSHSHLSRRYSLLFNSEKFSYKRRFSLQTHDTNFYEQYSKINIKKILLSVLILYFKRIGLILLSFLNLFCYFSSTDSITKYFKLKRYFNLVFYKASGELTFITKIIDKQRKKIIVIRPYDLPSVKISFISRMFTMEYYKIDLRVLLYLLDTQISLFSLIFFKMDMFFITVFFLKYELKFYILLCLEDFRFLLLYLNLKYKHFCILINFFIETLFYTNLKDRLFKYSVFLIFISKDLISYENENNFFPINWFFVFLNVHFHSLDIFTLQNTFIHTKIHLLFSCGTFIAWYYCYMIISLFPTYIIFSLAGGSWELLICCFTFIVFIGTVSTFVMQPFISLILGLISCLVSYLTKVYSCPLGKFLEYIFLPTSTLKLLREKDLTSMTVWSVNILLFYLIAIYKLSRWDNKVE
ncbi:hypothetical protein H312_00936, partial [Anncaliia algerae PRA339]